MTKPWEKYQGASSGAKPWEKYKAPEPGTSKAESLLRGAGQGVSMGFADELTAGLGGAYDAAQAALGNRGDISFGDAYRTRRDAIRRADAKAAEDNPATYTAGEIGGSVLSSFTPGGLAGGAAKGAGTAAKIGKAAGQGAVQAAGLSTADVTKGNLQNFGEDVALGAVTGAGMQGAMSGLGAVAKNVTPTNAAKKAANVFLNTPEEITDIYIKNPKGVMNAPKRFELAQTVDDTLQKLRGEVTEGSAKSRQILADEGKFIPSREIADIYDDKAKEILARSEGVFDDPKQEAAYKWLKDTGGKFRSEVPGGMGPEKKLSTNRLKDSIQAIDNQVDYETAPGKFSPIDDRVKKYLRSQMDARLKSESPAYAEQMSRVAPDTALLQEASGIAKTPGAMSNVLRRIETDQYGGGQVPKDVLAQLDQRMGTNILEQAKLSNAREAFDKSITNGSMNVNKFSKILEKAPAGQILGPVLGGTVDKYGRKMTMGAVDTAVKLNQIYQSQGAEAFRRNVAPLLNAARSGDPAAVLTFQMLSKANPQAVRDLE